MGTTGVAISFMESCRLCYSEARTGVDIFSSSEGYPNISLISKHLKIQICQNDSFSKILCLNCWQNLTEFHCFYLYIHEKQIKKQTSNGNLIQIEVPETSPLNNWKDSKSNSSYCDFNGSNDEELEACVTTELISICQDKKTTSTSNEKPNSRASNTGGNNHQQQLDNKIAAFFKTLPCSLCANYFSTFSAIRTHYRQQHQIHRGFVFCCGQKFLLKYKLTDHIDLHENPEAFKCRQCHRNFNDSGCLKMHLLEHDAAAVTEKHECDECGKKFLLKSLVLKHLLHHRNVVPLEQRLLHECRLNNCKKDFRTKRTLYQHIRDHHRNTNQKVVCDICAKVFTSKSAFERHYEDHHVPRTPKVPCSICGSGHRNEKALSRHMRNYHSVESEEKIVCPICGKLIKNKLALAQHIKYIHNSKPLHKCNVCHKSFKRPINLKDHIATHTGDRLYMCQYCPATFAANANLYSHRKRAHKEEWLNDRTEQLK